MDSIKFALGFLLVLFLYVGVTKVLMNVANHIGEQLGLGKSLIRLLQKKSLPK